MENNRRLRRRRSGTYVVEFAIVSSIFFVVLLASFELARLQYLRHTLQYICYESARAGIIPGKQPADVRRRAQNLADAARINISKIDVQPAAFDETTQTVEIRLVCDVDENTWLPSRFFQSDILVSTITLDHENKVYQVEENPVDQMGNNQHEPIDK